MEAAAPALEWASDATMPEPLGRSGYIYVVREGRVGIVETTWTATRVMSAILEPGAVYSTLDEVPTPEMVTLTDAAVSPIGEDIAQALLARHPRFGQQLAVALSERIAQLRETVAAVSEIRVEDRLEARVHQLAGRFGIVTPEGVELRLDLTHSQWATLVGASRESVTLAFGRLRARSAIGMSGRIITLPLESMRSRDRAA